MSHRQHRITWGSNTIVFALQRADRQRVAIEVNPDRSVLVRAPKQAALTPVLDVVRKKARWILRQQRYFEQFLPRTPTRQFVSGEAHLYLGRKYRLKIHAVDGDECVKLSAGYLHIYCRDAGDSRSKQKLLEDWYRVHAGRMFGRRLEACIDHRAFRKLPVPSINIRRMRKRWGSCTKAGQMLLNLDLIRASRACIDYVVTHELCHLLVPDHSNEFTLLLGRVMPDWKERKQRLESTLS